MTMRADRLSKELAAFERAIDSCAQTALPGVYEAHAKDADAARDACLAILAEAEKEVEAQRDARLIEERLKFEALAELDEARATLSAICAVLGYSVDTDAETLLRRVRYLDAVERCVLEQSHAVGFSETTADTRTRVVAMRREIERLRKPREEQPL
jgi:hypothetical protein